MGRLSYIFVVIFMGAMLFTVFAYIPLIEEETSTKKIECPKKAPESGPDSDEDETESDVKPIVGTQLNLEWLLSGKDYLHIKGFHHYFCLMEDMTTPPPRF